ncbi:unnamed protein product (macronuclear) [Paramecium tetraurelia]|uniref:Uncharacterized protein n=1 Tax=Paramecium tetraurelia TaxID=5888 RepID=A0C2K4_PARTE|nr:uncharacterized protein GSPATT00034499001 [Paramecium tetraurelia]CAK65021.1 unnamed protein product [Paramecium tetraurelia]|eukprot:XP_001432418.1 hypothetical protein (macronuclear) [Paramecium tetraurelia strain d4-2]
MKIVQDKQICQEHGKKFLFVETSLTTSKLKKLCEKCILQQNRSLIAWENVEYKYYNLTSKIAKESQTKIANNTFIFKQLKDSLLTFYAKFSSQLEQFSSQLQQYENFIIRQKVDISHDFTIEAIQNISKQLSTQNQNLKQIKQSILNQLKNFYFQDFQNQTQNLLDQISYWKADSEQVIEKQLFEELEICKSPTNYDWRCKKHDKDIIFADLNLKQTVPTRLACFDCLSEYQSLFTELKQFQLRWENHAIQIKEEIIYKQNILQADLKNKQNLLCQLEEEFQVKVNSIKSELEKISTKKQIDSQLYLMNKEWSSLSLEELSQIADLLSQNQLSTSEEEQKSKIQDQQINEKINNTYQQLNDLIKNCFNTILQENFNLKEENLSSITNEESNNQEFEEYIIQQQTNHNQLNINNFQNDNSAQDQVTAAVFDSNSKVFIVGYSSGIIQVFTSNDKILIVNEKLKQHKGAIHSLCFLKDSKSFLSGSQDETIKIWCQKNQGFQIESDLIEIGYGSVYCTIMNKKQNLLIAGCELSLVFWDKIENRWKQKQTLELQNKSVRSLSLNASTQILVCSFQSCSQIDVYWYQNHIWEIKQRIEIKEMPSSVCIINDFIFTCQVIKKNALYVFKKEQKTFTKKEEIKMVVGENFKQYQPQQFVVSKQILLNIIGNTINLLKIIGKETCILEQTIQFQNNDIFATLSESGEHLVTWEKKSQKFQLWKLENKIKFIRADNGTGQQE